MLIRLIFLWQELSTLLQAEHLLLSRSIQQQRKRYFLSDFFVQIMNSFCLCSSLWIRFHCSTWRSCSRSLRPHSWNGIRRVVPDVGGRQRDGSIICVLHWFCKGSNRWPSVVEAIKLHCSIVEHWQIVPLCFYERIIIYHNENHTFLILVQKDAFSSCFFVCHLQKGLNHKYTKGQKNTSAFSANSTTGTTSGSVNVISSFWIDIAEMNLSRLFVPSSSLLWISESLVILSLKRTKFSLTFCNKLHSMDRSVLSSFHTSEWVDTHPWHQESNYSILMIFKFFNPIQSIDPQFSMDWIDFYFFVDFKHKEWNSAQIKCVIGRVVCSQFRWKDIQTKLSRINKWITNEEQS